MARVEIDETDLLAKDRVVDLFNKALQDPKARPLLQQAVKAIRPDAVIPELDAKVEVLGVVSGVEKKIDDFIAAQAKDREDRLAAEKQDNFQRTWDNQKADLRSRGWTEEGITAVEKLAQEQGIAHLPAAAALYEKNNPPGEIATPSGGFSAFTMFEAEQNDADEMKRLMDSHGDDGGALNSLVAKALNDHRGVRR